MTSGGRGWTAAVAGPGDSVVWNEFAAVRVSVDESGLTPRLRLEDLESGESTLLDPVELASFITTPDQLRLRWLDVGPYLVTTDSASAL